MILSFLKALIPLKPGLVIICLLDRGIKAIVLKPVVFFLFESIKFLFEVFVLRETVLYSLCRGLQERLSSFIESSVVRLLGITPEINALNFIPFEETLI